MDEAELYQVTWSRLSESCGCSGYSGVKRKGAM